MKVQMGSPAIQINDLTKFYGKTRGIEHVNMQVEEGEIFGFIGPNGAGKSTTIRILLNLIFPTFGSARIMGMDVTGESGKIAKLTGYVPSDANAYPEMKVKDFLEYCMRFYDKAEEKTISRMAEIFDLDLSRKIGDLSMGNRKKVSILQALVHKPRLLILDEPTTGLDPLIQSRFFDFLHAENREGMTIFFSSHILSEIQMFCKRVAIIREGSIAKIEDIETLRRRQLRKIKISFMDKTVPRGFNIAGMEKVLSSVDQTLIFMYSGRIDDLIFNLRDLKLEDMTIEEPSLEEIFMHYYR
jgi:ABC-2 type transport system ATP-binding protein